MQDTIHTLERQGLRNLRFKKFMITIWDERDKANIWKTAQEQAKYAIMSDDDKTEEGQLHWHCFVQFDYQVRASIFKTSTAHYERSFSDIGSIDYCKNKGPNYMELGKYILKNNNGKDWEKFIEVLKNYTINEIIESEYSMLYARYRQFAGEVMTRFRKLETIQGELKNEWYWGPTGTGKSRKAREENPGAYLKNQNKWWDGYDDEKVVIIEEWSPEVKGLTNYMKIWCDRYPFLAEIKGSAIKIRPEKIIVTSNYSIDECFEGTDLEAIRRRFRVTQFHERLG